MFVFITGASSGIGKAAALEFARLPTTTRLCLTARRIHLLQALLSEIQSINSSLPVHIVALDVSDSSQVLQLPNTLPPEFLCPDVLIVNAGLALDKLPVHEYDLSDVQTMFDVNCVGAFATIRALLPAMIAQGHVATIIATTSVAAKAPYATGAAYCASKAATEAMMVSLRHELVHTPIRVCTIAPGMVGQGTEFSKVRFKGDQLKADQVYVGIDELHAADIAEAMVFVATRPPRVQIADIFILPTNQAENAISRKLE